MARHIVLVRHDSGPEDDRVVGWLRRHGVAYETRRPFLGDRLSPLEEDVAGSVVFGGPFEAYDHARHRFLKEEARWIEACMQKNVPLLGICQGAQQIAHVLGAEIGPAAEGWCEFGYYRVEPTEAGRDVLPKPLHLAQSHFHTFGLPAGAERLASSALFPNQAFRAGRSTYAFQFHAEVTPSGFRRWQESSGSYGRPGAQSREEQDRRMQEHDAAQDAWFRSFLDRLFGDAAAASSVMTASAVDR